ncbi:hypothetical protein ONE63_007535 [Megalurothrips usitatus]|uniref:Histidine-rich glycoprotein-like n=1 Tax=Megalurothrips usitatus TaxID=439358 RepID=A0AAV7XS84_9NEOP|nr:hypothetical protein ONE63_007535 [Megalurothrips usitatus]
MSSGRKIIIHVPYYIKNHHHTHTVYKYVKKDQHGAGGDSGEGGASLDQEHKGHGAGEAGDDFGDHHHHDGDAEFVGHHHHHHHHGPHDDGEATHTTPQALGLHGEPRPDDHHQHPHRYHHDDGGDYHQHPQQHHGGNAGHHDGDLHPNGNAGHHDGDFHHNQHQQQRLREEGSHFHHHEQGGRQHHHHHHEGDGERGHAHFHSKFVIGTNGKSSVLK